MTVRDLWRGYRFRVGDWVVNESGGPARMVVDYPCAQHGGLLRRHPARLIAARPFPGAGPVEIELAEDVLRLATTEEIPR